MTKDQEAVRKLARAHEDIRRAEEAIREVTREDLIAAGYGVAEGDYQVDGRPPLASNLIYDVLSYASALKIIRGALFNEYLA